MEPAAALLDHPKARVRTNAAYALGLRGTEEDVLRILPLKDDDRGLVRMAEFLFEFQEAGDKAAMNSFSSL